MFLGVLNLDKYGFEILTEFVFQVFFVKEYQLLSEHDESQQHQALTHGKTGMRSKFDYSEKHTG